VNQKIKLSGLIISLFLLRAELAIGSELKIHECNLYTVDIANEGEVLYRGGKEYTFKTGKPLRLKVLNYEEDIKPETDFIDVEAVIGNVGKGVAENVEVRLAVSPKIGSITHLAKTDGDPSNEEMEELSEWFCPKILMKQSIKEIKEYSSQKVIFRLNFKELYDSYSEKQLFVSRLMFMLSVDPQNPQINFGDDTTKIIVRISVEP
jgi:hypothetical protein